MKKTKIANAKKPNLLVLLKNYQGYITLLIILGIVSSGFGLFLPKIASSWIDTFEGSHHLELKYVYQFAGLSVVIFIATFLQGLVQTLASENVAKDLRTKLIQKISLQSYDFIEKQTSAKLLTNITADVDSIKLFISLAVASIISSIVIIFGASGMLLYLDLKLALAVLTIIPLIGFLFFILFSQVKVLFKASREVIDKLNRIINESVFGATLIRVLNSKNEECAKFDTVNIESRDVGIKILNIFASLIPLVTFIASLATLTVLLLGGYFVVNHSMTLGGFAAFNSYIMLLIFPIIILGFMSNLIAQASASYERIMSVLDAVEPTLNKTTDHPIVGNIELSNVYLSYNKKPVLKNISLNIKANTKTAIIGPTAAGKTQLINLLIGLTKPDSGDIIIDGHNINEINPQALHRQVGLVFQDSILFNLSLKENIDFSDSANEPNIVKAIKTAELEDLIASLPNGLSTIISERGTNLSGGQKQRIMLARALAINPRILLLDDFTARVDNKTEQNILANLAKDYTHTTLISVTQKISAIKNYDQIILLMEGELIGTGTHAQLLSTCPEYAQIYSSQQSTNEYE
ncbi:MAG: ABC transporter ATP-binding protein [bacterium]